MIYGANLLRSLFLFLALCPHLWNGNVCLLRWSYGTRKGKQVKASCPQEALHGVRGSVTCADVYLVSLLPGRPASQLPLVLGENPQGEQACFSSVCGYMFSDRPCDLQIAISENSGSFKICGSPYMDVRSWDTNNAVFKGLWPVGKSRLVGTGAKLIRKHLGTFRFWKF